MPQFARENLIPLFAGHENIVRIVTPANALSLVYPIRTKKTLRALRVAVQSFFLQ
jgi:hypothetical protein